MEPGRQTIKADGKRLGQSDSSSGIIEKNGRAILADSAADGFQAAGGIDYRGQAQAHGYH
ncbi:MAG: hypothetical protein CG440_412 [Methanosaeta sp. NSM2]|nr:MAG: hypothetical protein CG440_412 [Methanosaeta sp. NSM2]